MAEWNSVILLFGSASNIATDSIAAAESLNVTAFFERSSSTEALP
jgi:hypothetical protein